MEGTLLMKNFIKILILVCIAYCMPTITMEQVNTEESTSYSDDFKESLIGIFPNELWEIIFSDVYFDLNACDGDLCDVLDSINSIETKVSNNSKKIRLVCKTFNFINDQVSRGISKDQLRKFYKSLLINKLLKQPGCERLKNTRLVKFLSTGDDNGIISQVISQAAYYQKLGLPLDVLPKAIALLLYYGADINGKGRGGDSAIHQAVRQYRDSAIHQAVPQYDYNNDLMDEVIRLLLAHGAVVNIQNDQGDTALHFALRMQDVRDKRLSVIVKILLEYGADRLNIRNNAGNNATDKGPDMHRSMTEFCDKIKNMSKNRI